MKNINARAICEGAIISALTVVLLIMGTYVPIFRMFAIFLCGVPLAYLVVKQGTYISIASFFVSLVLMFVITGDFLSGSISALVNILPGFVVGYCIRSNARYKTTLMSAAIAVLFGLVIEIMILNLMSGAENGVVAMVDDAINSMRTSLEAYISSSSQEMLGESNVDVMQVAGGALSQSKTLILSYFPTLLIIISAIVGYMVTVVCAFILKKLGVKNCRYPRFCMLRVSRGMCTATIIFMVISLLSSDSSIYTLALKNMVAVLSFIIAVAGFSLVEYSLKSKIKNKFARFLIYFLVLIFGYIFLSIIFYVLMFAGMIDANVNVRRINKVGDEHEG